MTTGNDKRIDNPDFSRSSTGARSSGTAEGRTPVDDLAPNDDPGAETDSGPPLLEMSSIDKAFFGVPVLERVDFDCRRREVHAVVGENGAGKSTLMKILAGVYQPDGGTVHIDGEEVTFHHARDAQLRGISIIFQEFNLLPERTVAQNIFLGREPVRGVSIERDRMDTETGRLLEGLRVADAISPRSLVKNLSVAQQQMVEIAKALSLDARILVMDEPTAALSLHEVESLFERVHLLKDRGMGIIYISHRLKEVFDLADRITVLKDGKVVGTRSVQEVTTGELVKMMVGRQLDRYFPDRADPAAIGDVKLRLRGASNDRLTEIDLEVRSGEILGVAGLQGSGRSRLARALFGVDPFTAGTIEHGGKRVRLRSPRDALDLRFGFLTEDRKTEGLVLPHSIRANALLALRSLRSRKRSGSSSRSLSELVHSVDMRAAGLDQEVRYLSGGNQQKVVLAKWLAIEPDILIFDEPTRGIDVGAKAGIHELMRDLANSGVAIIMVSSELPEVLGMSDRIIVMRNGSIAGELPAGASEAEIMLLATGESEEVA